MSEPVQKPPMPDAVWAVTQVVPSPQLAIAEKQAHFGLRWQVTPVLYSFGAHRGTSPWRALIVEPALRQSGSIEAFASPEYLAIGDSAPGRWSVRLGTRAYFPLVEHGEYLSMSLGTSYSTFAGGGVGYEGGVYVFFGVFGIQVTYSPSPMQPPLIVTLRFRYF